MRKLLLSLSIAIAGLLALAFVFRAPLSLRIAERIAPGRLAADVVPSLPDGLHVALCGAGSPFPDTERSGPCTVVVAGKRMFVFDAGGGSARNIGRLGFVLGHVEAIFLTHFHSDHIDGLGEVLLQRWVTTSNTAPVPVYGPPGVEQVPVERSQVPLSHWMLSVHWAQAPAVHTRPPPQSSVCVHGEPSVPAPPAPSAGIAAGSVQRNSWHTQLAPAGPLPAQSVSTLQF